MRLNQKGFSLLEILIATLILAWIATETTKAIRGTQNTKVKIDESIDTYQAIRASFTILRRDLSNIFHLSSCDFLPYGHKLPESRPTTPTDLRNAENYRNYIEQNYPGLANKSYFIGEESELHFTGIGHYRLYSDRHESDQAEYSYIIEKDRDYPDRLHLLKREHPVIDDKFDEGGEFYLILSDLASLKFRYYDLAKDQWHDRWDNTQPEHQDELPDMIELKFVVNSRNPINPDDVKKLELVTSFKPNFDNSCKKTRIGGLAPLEKELAAAKKDAKKTGTTGTTGTTTKPNTTETKTR